MKNKNKKYEFSLKMSISATNDVYYTVLFYQKKSKYIYMCAYKCQIFS